MLSINCNLLPRGLSTLSLGLFLVAVFACILVEAGKSGDSSEPRDAKYFSRQLNMMDDDDDDDQVSKSNFVPRYSRDGTTLERAARKSANNKQEQRMSQQNMRKYKGFDDSDSDSDSEIEDELEVEVEEKPYRRPVSDRGSQARKQQQQQQQQRAENRPVANRNQRVAPKGVGRLIEKYEGSNFDDDDTSTGARNNNYQLERSRQQDKFGPDYRREVSKVSKMLARTMMTAYSQTKKSVGGAMKELPKYVSQASTSVQAILKLDSRGRLLALIQEADRDIANLRKSFNDFTKFWGPNMDKALDFVGEEELNDGKMKFKNMEHLDSQLDALNSLAFGYELMRMMISWRENLIIAHEAYKMYLEGVLADLQEFKGGPMRFNVDRSYVIHMRAIHNYLQLTSWLNVDQVTLEQRMKLEFLAEQLEDKLKQPHYSDGYFKGYNQDYFRRMLSQFHQMYTTLMEELESERLGVTATLTSANEEIGGASSDDFEEIDYFFDDFRHKLTSGAEQYEEIQWQTPDELQSYMQNLKNALQYNPVVYNKEFLQLLMAAKQEALRSMKE